MQGTHSARLLAAASLVAIAAVLPLGGAKAQSREAKLCADQTESMAEQRIAACSRMIESGRIRGKQEGVAYDLRGLAYLDRGDIADAIADLNKAITLAPDFAPAYQNRGNAWYARGNYGQALADYDMAIKLDPKAPASYINRATVRRDLGYVDGAFEDYKTAISLGADNARLYSGRAQLYLRQRDYPHALADFDHALKLDASAENYAARARAKQDSGDFDGALADYA